MEGRKEGAYGTEEVRGDEPLQLGLWDVEVPADGRERDGDGGHVRGLEVPFIYAHPRTTRVNGKEGRTFKIIARVTVPIRRKSFALDRLGCVAGSSFWMEVMEPASLSLVTARSFSVGEGSGCC